MYDIRSGRFDPVGALYALLLREMSKKHLIAESGAGRSSVYKALSAKAVSHRIALLILRALARHPRSLPTLD